MAIDGHPADRQHIHAELERVRADLHHLVAHATEADLARRTNGTRWTNGQMLWHMAFGYVLVRRLLPLVRLFGRLPERFSRLFASALNGGVGGALVFRGPRLTRQLDHTIDRLHRSLEAETEDALARWMHFPVGWDPFFRDTMTLEQVYHYATEHYDFHRSQLTLR
jgi:hypothetical protein